VRVEDKEKVVLVVGRIGAESKNHGMLLDALDGFDLGDWSVVFVGGIDDSFRPAMDRFFAANPAAADRVCQGTLLSRQQYLTDIGPWEYADARLVQGHMTPADIAHWTAAIDTHR
jgi:hypothetical protein